MLIVPTPWWARGRWWNTREPPPEPTTVKVLNETHCAFGQTRAAGDIFAGGGRYEAEDGLYRETVTYHTMPELVGVTIPFRFRIEGDLWYHEGEVSAGGRRFHINEVWRRVD